METIELKDNEMLVRLKVSRVTAGGRQCTGSVVRVSIGEGDRLIERGHAEPLIEKGYMQRHTIQSAMMGLAPECAMLSKAHPRTIRAKRKRAS